MSRIRSLVLALCLGSLYAAPSHALAQAYQLSLEDESGSKLRTFAHRGQVFALGEHGRRYNVRVTNNTGRRVEAVVTVDGRDVLSGQPGDYTKQRGYVLPAHGSVLIEGFRTSLSEVASFRFTDPGDSYSSRMGTPENVGVIGAAFFGEMPPPPPVLALPRARREASDGLRGTAARAPAPAAASAESAPAKSSSASGAAPSDERASNIGTQYGEQRQSQASETEFKRARPTRPDRVLVVRYDDRAGLEARGIRTEPRPQPVKTPVAPNPFPVNRFAPPPPAIRTEPAIGR